MSNTINQDASCGCNTSPASPLVQNIPGPQGASGANAYGTTGAVFTVPAVNSGVQIQMAALSGPAATATGWLVAGQFVYIQSAGFYQILSVDSSSLFTAKNLGYTGNAAVGVVIASASQVSPAGLQGPTGSLNTISPTTTKGDLIVDNGANNPAASDARMPAGSDKTILHADSSQANGLRYGAVDLGGGSTSLSGILTIANGGTGKTTQQQALNNLMPPSPTAGELVYFDGVNWSPLSLSGAPTHQILRTNLTGNAPEWAYQGLIQQAYTIKPAAASYGFTALGVPFDDTVPIAYTNCAPWISVTLTAKSASSIIRIDTTNLISPTAKGFVALFMDTTLIGIAYAWQSVPTSLTICADVPAADLLAHTYTVQFGTNAGGTCYIGGSTTSRLAGGAGASFMRVSEIQT